MMTLLLAAVTLAFVAILSPFLTPILWALIIALVFAPVFRHTLRWTGERRTLAALLTLAGVLLLVVLPLQLMGVHGQSATLVGLQMLALSAPMLVLPMLAARWAERVGSARLCTLGLLVCASGLYLLSRHASQPSPSQWVPWLMLVGAGTALPWGLMDGLSVSVVPVQRAGMAAGIFGTVRVAGEGIALAAVTALLALLIGHQLQGASPASLARAGAYLATGAREQAQALLPAMSRMQLQHASSEALATLLRVLALLTAACAALLHLLLRKRKDALVGRTA